MSDIKFLAQKAWDLWGLDAQLNMVIEECAELIDAIQKWRRNRIDSVKVLEEVVDVELMLEQMKVILGMPMLFENIKKNKLEQLEKLLGKPE